MEELQASAPGRVCLFGEHQDYLGLPVIAAAISLRICATGRRSRTRTIEIDMPDIRQHATLLPNEKQEYQQGRDYLRSSVTVLQRRGLTWSSGWDVVVRGEIPINAGVSSSSALVVMWLRFLIAISDQQPDIAPEDLARLAHEAEVIEFGEPGGMMDHFCAAVGGVLYIDTRPPYVSERLPVQLEGIVLGNSNQPKATLETLAARRADVAEGIRMLRTHMPQFDLATTDLAEVEPLLARLPERPARRLRANLINRDLTRQALHALRRGDATGLGPLLLRHHQQLRDGLDLSTPRIEAMLEAAMRAGALGGKVNGSGGGGCMFAYAPGHEEDVAEAMRRAGGTPYIVHVADGARVETVAA